MTLNLVRRSTKGAPLTAIDHDGNLDKIEQAIEAVDPAGFATAAQGAKADSAIQPAALSSALADKVDSADPRLADAREWSAETVSQAEAEAGTATARRAWTALRVAQAIAAWWAGSAAKTKLDGIAAGATANATDAQLRDRSTHTGTQAVGTITGLAAVATSGAYSDLSGRPTLGSAAATETTAYATAAQGAKADTAVQPATLSGYVQASDARLSDAREWSAETIGQAEAETGTATTRRAFTAQRVFQAIAAWWAASSAKTKLDGIASGATNTPLSDATPQSPGTAAAGTSNSAARGDHVHPLPATVSTSAAGLARATGYGTINYAAQVTLDFAALAGQMNTISLTGNLELLASNLANGREVRLRLVCDSTQRNLTFPVNWKFVGTKPANIAASKVAILSLAAFGTTDADVVAAYAVQS